MKTLTDKWYLLPLILIVLMLIGKKAKGQVGNTEIPPDTLQVKALLEAYGVKHVDIVLRQTVLETGWYKCTNCSMRYNNLFGFRLKKHVSDSNPLGYIPFKNWQESVKRFAWYQKTYYNEEKYPNYYDHIRNSGWSSSPTYVEYLKKMW